MRSRHCEQNNVPLAEERAAQQEPLNVPALVPMIFEKLATTLRDSAVLFKTHEDFARVPKRPRLVVIGGTGSGKSTLLNILAGYKLRQSRASGYEFQWFDSEGGSVDDPSLLLFESRQRVTSVTDCCAFTNATWRGLSGRSTVVLVDTPGYDDLRATTWPRRRRRLPSSSWPRTFTTN